jgi:hypothetical protein
MPFTRITGQMYIDQVSAPTPAVAMNLAGLVRNFGFFVGVAVLPPVSSGASGVLYVFTGAQKPNLCPVNNGAPSGGGLYTAACITYDNVTWRSVLMSDTNGSISLNGGAATTLVCWKSDGMTLGYATMNAGNISACN